MQTNSFSGPLLLSAKAQPVPSVLGSFLTLNLEIARALGQGSPEPANPPACRGPSKGSAIATSQEHRSGYPANWPPQSFQKSGAMMMAVELLDFPVVT